MKLGGQIGIGVHPIGWDKSYIFNDPDSYKEIIFMEIVADGNDYPLYSYPKIKGHYVKSPKETMEIQINGQNKQSD